MRFALVVLGVFSAGCDSLLSVLDTTPAKLEVQAPSGPLMDKNIHSLSPRVRTAHGKPLPDQVAALSWSSTPVGVAEVSSEGVRCLKSGDASIIVTGAGLSSTFTVQCRLVAAISVQPRMDLLLNEPDAAFTATAKDDNGKSMSDVEIGISSSDPTVVAISGDHLNARSVGVALITARAGDAEASTEVRVIERLATETLALSDGETVAYTLNRGRYRVDIQVNASDGSGYGVTVTSTAGGCPNKNEAQRHQYECEVADTTSLVITNPTTFGLGPAEMGNISIYRIP